MLPLYNRKVYSHQKNHVFKELLMRPKNNNTHRNIFKISSHKNIELLLDFTLKTITWAILSESCKKLLKILQFKHMLLIVLEMKKGCVHENSLLACNHFWLCEVDNLLHP